MPATLDRVIVYEAVPFETLPGAWLVDAVDWSSEGELYAVIFDGSNARARAEEYAEWKNRYASKSRFGVNKREV